MKKIKRKISRIKSNIRKAPLSSYVVFSFGMIIIFTIVMIILFCLYQQVPDVLVTCYYGCFAGEVLMAALIKIMKLKGEDRDGMDN